MKISTKGRYGLRILFDIAINANGTPRMLKDIAASQNISEKYISRLVIDLREAGLVKSVRGSKGGYMLAKFPEEITLLQVVEIMEGHVNIVDCVMSPSVCDQVKVCTVRKVWTAFNDKIRAALGEVTLKDIVDQDRQDRRDGVFVEYCI